MNDALQPDAEELPVRHTVLIGLGAIGTVIAANLTKHAAPGETLRIAADAVRIAAYKQSPPTLNSHALALDYICADAAQQPPPADLILITVKSPGLMDAMQYIAPFVGAGTRILPLLNGITAHEMLADVFGTERVWNGLVFSNSAMREGRNVLQHGAFNIVFGAVNPNVNADESQRLSAAADYFSRHGLSNEIAADMQTVMWRKYILNTGLNQAQAVYRLPMGAMRRNPDAMTLMDALMCEAAAIAAAHGTPDADKQLAAAREALGLLSDDAKSSMLQDVEAGRPTEVDLFAQTISRLGREYGIPTPANDAVAAQLA